jgi:hypothetical protein
MLCDDNASVLVVPFGATSAASGCFSCFGPGIRTPINLNRGAASATNDTGKLKQNTEPHDEMTDIALQQNAGLIRFIEHQTPALCLTAVRYGGYDDDGYFLPGYALEHIRPDAQTHEICMAAVRENGNVLRYVRPDLRTHEICLAAVTTDGCALQYVPAEIRTPDILHAAINDWGAAIQYIRPDEQTPELCELAIATSPETALREIKELTSELCLFAVQLDYRALRNVPEHLRTEEICLAAVTQSGYALLWIPVHQQTPAICYEAIRRNGHAKKLVKIPL